MSNTPLLQLRQLGDIDHNLYIHPLDMVHSGWVYFRLGCEDWVRENQSDPHDCPDYVGVLLGDSPLPDWIHITSRWDERQFLVESGSHLVDVYGKTCTWYHWRSSEEIRTNISLSRFSECRWAQHVPDTLLGRGAVLLNTDDPDYDKYEGKYKSILNKWAGVDE